MVQRSFSFGSFGHTPGRRQAPRVRLALPGKVVLLTGYENCLLNDLSETGACVTVADMAPALGQSAILMVDGVEAFGAVVWRCKGQFGLSFDQPLAKADVVRLRELHDHYEALEQQNLRRRAADFVQGRRTC